MELKLMLNVLHLPCNNLTHTNFHVQFVTKFIATYRYILLLLDFVYRVTDTLEH